MTCPAPFTIGALCRSTAARTGTLALGRGVVQTPVFMPVGTQAAIRTVPPHHLRAEGAQIILANTYHLHQRPGSSLIEKLGGLHRFMGVDLPILTDSGGFQVFSLDKKEVSEEGVRFSYELDGKQTFLSPETSMAIQQALGSDIAMAFDECLPPDADVRTVTRSIDLTARWAERSLKAHARPDQSLFGIVQGGMFPELRRRSVAQITSLPFDGFALGGLSVGEGPDVMNAVLGETMPHMPTGTARYLMGVGRPQDLVDGVATGIDMFDCVIPTRHARGGVLYTFQGRIRISHGSYRRDAYPVDTACSCYTCTHFSRAYLHHLFDIGEVLGSTLATIHNLRFFADLMARVRATIADGTFASFRKDVKALYPEKDEAASDAKKQARAGMARRDPDAPAPTRGAPATGPEAPAPQRSQRPERPDRGAQAPTSARAPARSPRDAARGKPSRPEPARPERDKRKAGARKPKRR
ncbi:MAG: tRNA guanosine(34) transglycosylase Tgt [Deltaproteobacteria bacterium]|nr:tRNA guanosine(34) transglycosylase Tgt [Deltaproteobacteria bacterium]